MTTSTTASTTNPDPSARPCRLGIDVGSTTAKLVVLDQAHRLLFAEYLRHNAEVFTTLVGMLERALERFGDQTLSVAITGTAGMGVSEKTGIHFIQEVVSSANVVRALYPEVRTLIDLGGEDAKIIFFNERMKPDIRMNGACAGGTGAFIDQMATLLNVSVEDLDRLAARHTSVYPIASRCGVFAKTDVQNLISRDVPREEIAASIFRAVALQSVNALSRGFKITPKVLFSGGPLTFLPMLRQAFREVLQLSDAQTFVPERPELVTAIGAALSDGVERTDLTLAGLLERLRAGNGGARTAAASGPEALFADEAELQSWSALKDRHQVGRVALEELDGQDCFLGIDSGSTTTKVVLTDAEGRLGLTHYATNDGNPIEAVLSGLERVRARLAEAGVAPRIARTAVTGYGEDLIRSALRIDEGLVETIAHYRAAKFFDPEVSFILDIGGQDMKAIFVRDGVINDLEINEACSSGAGSFIQTFARSLGYEVTEFARLACASQHPCDLGTRCTVFMNSKVKQSLREGATIGDISAGLAYSVVKNCFNKVLKISNPDLLGAHVVVQGGTFRNPAVLRALERVIGREVVRPDIAELMGAYGAALHASDRYAQALRAAVPAASTFIGLDDLERARHYERKTLMCKGCENTCTISRLTFEGDRVFFTGNKCERVFSNQGADRKKGLNLHETKRALLFERSGAAIGGRERPMKIGIPRALNQFENFPYWNTLLTECGFEVVLSSPSSVKLAEKGAGTVMSENICFPAKLTNGHVLDLIGKRVDRILFPMVRYEQDEHPEAVNYYNCPVVTGYPDVIRSAVDPALRHGVPYDKPEISFTDDELLAGSSWAYLKTMGVKRPVFER
ncbi:MAG TPA: CoA activase, partial [Myxococcales bacterium]|nr:CoA activase [Myxococcales bacterium]